MTVPFQRRSENSSRHYRPVRPPFWHGLTMTNSLSRGFYPPGIRQRDDREPMICGEMAEFVIIQKNRAAAFNRQHASTGRQHRA